VLIGSFDELAAFEAGPGADEGGEVRRVHGAPAVCADSMSLNDIARPAARETGPLVIFVRCLTVAKVDSINLAGFQNSATHPDLGFYAARSYLVTRAPRTGWRLIRCGERSATGWSSRGGRSWRLR
jgi:hypothetical protein